MVGNASAKPASTPSTTGTNHDKVEVVACREQPVDESSIDRSLLKLDATGPCCRRGLGLTTFSF